ncbi:CGNR zinc finger domain-containing protein [Sphaerisporangium sp. TRM90804]|uniref:CGNR zinc finger domain-containing protein n=1 Tax=Sphaerisporangium sp. TRM90804 TaxID=3031113 RepID=UPI0024468294|nr:CGNR zinc finger domain-containing protein [Sphaerisporangium sp. TRM90804]MDH2428320.1 CGNR zinc finger domain-containing protein [Sphaerisporangium sp. TRM90804]
MHLNPYGEDAVVFAADLANRPPAGVEELTRRSVEAGLLVDFPVREEDLARTLAVLRDWRELVDSGDDAERAELLNRMLASASAFPRLTDHAGDGWHLHYRDDRQSLAGVLTSVICVGTALHLVGRGMRRLGRCAADGCDLIYADVSRNGRQRYCSPRCANRDAVRRHRAAASARPPDR